MKLLDKIRTIDKLPFLLLILCGIVFFANLGGGEIQRWDEFTNIQVVKESSGVDLFFQNERFFEKPPLWYWLTSILTNVLGNRLWVYRLLSAFSGSAIVFTIYLFLKQKQPRAIAFLVAVGFLLIPHNIITNAGGYFSTHTFRSADLDGLQVFLMFLSFCLLQTSRKYWLVSCSLLGLGFLVKGPLAVLFLVINSIFYLSRKPLTRKEIRHFLAGIFLFGVLILPWHIYMYSQFGAEFGNIYFDYHIFDRVNQGLEGHNQSPWYILKIFLGFRVNPFWPLLLIVLLKKRVYKTSYLKYSLIIILSILGIFTLVETKLAWYILPVYPFVMIFLSGVFVKNSK